MSTHHFRLIRLSHEGHALLVSFSSIAAPEDAALFHDEMRYVCNHLRHRNVIVEFKGVSFFRASCLLSLDVLRGVLQKRCGSLVLRNMEPQIFATCHLLSLDKTFEIHDELTGVYSTPRAA